MDRHNDRKHSAQRRRERPGRGRLARTTGGFILARPSVHVNRATIRRMFREDYSDQEIVDELGVSVETMKRERLRMGLRRS